MFTKNKAIIYITKSKIKLVNVTMGKKPKEETIDEAVWMPDSLESILLKFKKNIKGSVRVLLAEDFVYTVTLTVPYPSVSREDVKKRAQEVIPENLDEIIWDFKKIGLANTIQVVAVAKGLLEIVSQSIAKAGIRIEAIEPLSLALARFTQREDNTTVFVYIDDGNVFVIAAQKGIVLGTEHLADLNVNSTTQFIRFTKERFNIEFKDIIFCGNTAGIDLTKFENENFKAQIQNISPIISLAHKVDLKGKDEEVLNFHLRGVVSRHLEGANVVHLEGGEASTSTPSRWAGDEARSPFKWIWVAGIILLVLVAAITAGFLFFQFQRRTNQTTPKPTQTESKPSPTIVTPTATSSAETDFSSYTIRVLNSSGKIGEAARLEGILKDNGFNVVEIGNAESSDYEKTEIRYKEKVPKEVILALDKILNPLYDFYIDTNLEEDAETDILIIIGNTVK